MDTMNTGLAGLGWSNALQTSFSEHESRGCVPLRVVRQHGERYLTLGAGGEYAAEISGRYRHEALSPGAMPCVGDWIAAQIIPSEQKALIQALLPRRSAFIRKAAGSRVEEQVVAANIDIVFLVNGLDGDFNPRRIERYITLAWESGARPVVLLSKADLCHDIDEQIAEVERVAFNVPVHAISAKCGDGLDAVRGFLGDGITAALLGSSGAGKSTIANAMLGVEHLATQAVREDDSRGRHTTSHRELMMLPSGGLLIDTPGMRELQLWAGESSLDNAFEDVAELAALCRFRDCAHGDEPGCAVREAIKTGALDKDRYRSYLKLQRELAHLARRENKPAQLAEKAKWKRIHMYAKQLNKERGRV